MNRKTPKSQTRLYRIWASMKQRCNNPNNADYKWYGGRGIKVCPQWENNFEAFERWSLANGYKENLTIDRIDNENGYNPGNCQWITRSDNARKNNKPITRRTFKYETDPDIVHYRKMMRLYNSLIKEGVDPSTIKKPVAPHTDPEPEISEKEQQRLDKLARMRKTARENHLRAKFGDDWEYYDWQSPKFKFRTQKKR